MRKKLVVKIFILDDYKLLYLFVVRKFYVFNFRRTWLLTKIFHAKFFPNYGIIRLVIA